jgi:hypothetical protein
MKSLSTLRKADIEAQNFDENGCPHSEAACIYCPTSMRLNLPDLRSVSDLKSL